jgi:hypothetical protein
MNKEDLQERIADLQTSKLQKIEALALVDQFIGRATDEAAYGLSPSMFGRMRAAGNAIDPAFENIDQEQAVKVQDRRLQPYVRSQLFIALVAEIEDFLGSLLRLIILGYPKKIADKFIPIDRLVDLGVAGALEEAIDSTVHELFYAKPQQYRNTVLRFLSGDSELVANFWPAYVELKARRDVGVHGDWRCNEIYEKKVSEVGLPMPTEEFLGISDAYFRHALEVGEQMTKTLSDHCLAKFCSAD